MQSDLPARAGPPIRVVIAEDHKIVLWGLQRLLDAAWPHLKVVGTAGTRAELLNHPALGEADIVLLDLDLSGEHSVDAMDDLQRRCSGHVLVLTGSEDPEEHRAIVRKGARGVLHKSEPAEVVLRAIDKVHAGEVWLSKGLLGQVLTDLAGRAPVARLEDPHQRRIASLTPREREIVVAMARRSGAKQLVVAEELGLSENTLRNHLTTIYSKLEVRGRLELYVYATEHGLFVAPRT